jgi:hypothetical protein
VKPTQSNSTERELFNQRELSRAALRSYLIALAGVINDTTRIAGQLAPSRSQTVIETRGCEIVYQLTCGTLSPTFVADLDEVVVSGSVGSAPVMPSTQTTEK